MKKTDEEKLVDLLPSLYPVNVKQLLDYAMMLLEMQQSEEDLGRQFNMNSKNLEDIN